MILAGIFQKLKINLFVWAKANRATATAVATREAEIGNITALDLDGCRTGNVRPFTCTR